MLASCLPNLSTSKMGMPSSSEHQPNFNGQHGRKKLFFLGPFHKAAHALLSATVMLREGVARINPLPHVPQTVLLLPPAHLPTSPPAVWALRWQWWSMLTTAIGVGRLKAKWANKECNKRKKGMSFKCHHVHYPLDSLWLYDVFHILQSFWLA
jgi:hypothetical protein